MITIWILALETSIYIPTNNNGPNGGWEFSPFYSVGFDMQLVVLWRCNPLIVVGS